MTCCVLTHDLLCAAAMQIRKAALALTHDVLCAAAITRNNDNNNNYAAAMQTGKAALALTHRMLLPSVAVRQSSKLLICV